MNENKILEALQGIANETKALGEQIAGLKASMNERMTQFEASQETQTRVFEERMTHIEVSYENETQKILNLLSEDYGRVADAVKKTKDYDEVKGEVKLHRQVLEGHNQRITKLEDKAI